MEQTPCAKVSDNCLRYVKVKSTHRWMKSWNVSFACEEKERRLAKKLIGPNLSSESVLLTFEKDGEHELRNAPFAFVPDLKAKIFQLLEQNDQ